MIKRLIWTIRTPMSSVLKKADKLNLSLSLSPLTLVLNPLWLSDAMWWHRTNLANIGSGFGLLLGSTNHYLNQCWIIIHAVLWYSPEGNFRGNAQDFCPWYEFTVTTSNIAAKYHRDQWGTQQSHTYNMPTAYCKSAVTPLLMHWSYCSLALSCRHVTWYIWYTAKPLI